MWKGFLYVFLPCFVLFWLITAYGYYRPAIKEYFLNKRGEAIFARVEAEKRMYEALEKVDTYGGKTPEETVDLFLVALKVGDIETASKYYDVRLQKEALESLKKEMSLNGNYNNSINYFEEVRKKGRKICVGDLSSCSIKYEYITKEDKVSEITGSEKTILIPQGTTRTKIIFTRLNTENNIWKITDPI